MRAGASAWGCLSSGVSFDDHTCTQQRTSVALAGACEIGVKRWRIGWTWMDLAASSSDFAAALLCVAGENA